MTTSLQPMGPAVALLATLTIATCAAADDFCVENKIFTDDGRLVASSTTMFHHGVVYDILADAEETIIFDPARQRVVLLDAQRRAKVEISATQIHAFAASFKAEAARASSPVLQFMATPDFRQQTDDDELVFDGRWMSYRLKTAAVPSESIARQYSNYVRLQTQLNVMRGNVASFPRLAVQDILDQSQRLPTQVQRTVTSELPGRSQRLRAEHRHQWRLLASDLRKIERADEQLATFTPMTLEQFQQPADASQARR